MKHRVRKRYVRLAERDLVKHFGVSDGYELARMLCLTTDKDININIKEFDTNESTEKQNKIR